VQGIFEKEDCILTVNACSSTDTMPLLKQLNRRAGLGSSGGGQMTNRHEIVTVTCP